MKRQSHFVTAVLITLFMAVPGASWGATILTLEAWEEDSSSCPWVYTWDGSEFVRDNDIYSVARYEEGEYTDYYVLQKPLVADDGSYLLEVREVTGERSWTDYVSLLAVDHGAGVSVGTDEKGDIFSYTQAELIAPSSAMSDSGGDVAAQLSTLDSSGFGVYSEEYVEVDFGNVDVSQGARVVLRVKGFMDGSGDDKPFIGPPAILVQAFNGTDWQEIGRLKPREEWSTGVFDLSANLPDPNGDSAIRLYSISHGTKYHEIDFVGLSIGSQPQIVANELTLSSAGFKGDSVLDVLGTADGNYLQMNPEEKFSLSFAATPPGMAERDFVFISKGYYIPNNTFYIRTWDGASWIERASYAYPSSDDTQTFDLTAFLPDGNNEYKVRIERCGDYGCGIDATYGDSGIDFVGLEIDLVPAALVSAIDAGDSGDILSLVNISDDVYFEMPTTANMSDYSWGAGSPPVPIPTLSRWAPYLFVMTLTGAAYVRIRRKA